MIIGTVAITLAAIRDTPPGAVAEKRRPTYRVCPERPVSFDLGTGMARHSPG
jgi:hypothetical protein